MIIIDPDPNCQVITDPDPSKKFGPAILALQPIFAVESRAEKSYFVK